MRIQKSCDYILTLTCQDRPGIVAAIATCLAEMACNIEESSQYGDPESKSFFMRVHFVAPDGCSKDHLCEKLGAVATQFSMTWTLNHTQHRTRTMIMVSKLGHCLFDLLYRWQNDALPIEITRIVSNHEDFQDAVELAGLNFTYLPLTPETKSHQESKLRDIIEQDEIELVVLARYMQILSPELAIDLAGRVINIHHSFLPSFKGAKPYHQAHERGVKIIGATAHYVTPDLDEGPIIEQQVETVDHTMRVSDLIAAGRDIEKRVLARAVKYHAEHRLLLNGSKTIVFRGW